MASDIRGASLQTATFEGYRTAFEKHLAIFDAKPLDAITRQDVSELISAKLTQKRSDAEGAKPLTRGMVRNILAPLRAMLSHAVDQGILR